MASTKSFALLLEVNIFNTYRSRLGIRSLLSKRLNKNLVRNMAFGFGQRKDAKERESAETSSRTAGRYGERGEDRIPAVGLSTCGETEKKITEEPLFSENAFFIERLLIKNFRTLDPALEGWRDIFFSSSLFLFACVVCSLTRTPKISFFFFSVYKKALRLVRFSSTLSVSDRVWLPPKNLSPRGVTTPMTSK